jgi:hypothetical protein
MEAVRTSETSVDNDFIRQYIPEDNSEILNQIQKLQHTVPQKMFIYCSDDWQSFIGLSKAVLWYFLQIFFTEMMQGLSFSFTWNSNFILSNIFDPN